MPRGGTRPGAGRKPTRERFARPIAVAEKQIADRLPFIIDKLFELAEGVSVREPDGHGGFRVYDRAPDYKAASYLADRILGKPTQAVEASGPDGKPLRIIVEYDDSPAPTAPEPAETPPGAADGTG